MPAARGPLTCRPGCGAIPGAGFSACGFSMASQRYTLAQAAQLLGLSVNGVRTRYKRGRLAGGKDNETGEIFVTLDPDDAKPAKASQASQGSRRMGRENPAQSMASQDMREGFEKALAALTDQLAQGRADHAAERDRLLGELAQLRAQLDQERDRRHAAELRVAEGLLARLLRVIGAR